MITQLNCRKWLLGFVMAGALSSCATAPEDVIPNRVDYQQYMHLTCEQLAAQIAPIEEEYQDHLSSLKRQRVLDATVLPGLSRITGKNKEHAEGLARTEGELNAMHQAQAEKQCTAVQ